MMTDISDIEDSDEDEWVATSIINKNLNMTGDLVLLKECFTSSPSSRPATRTDIA